MIRSKKDLEYYLKCDQIALNKANQTKPRYKHDIIWTYQRLLRKCEYIENCKSGIIWYFIGRIYKLCFVNLSHKLGFSIPLNVFGPGLSIAHYGQLVVNNNSKIGKNCRIHEGVTIGASGETYWPNLEKQSAPIIGDNVFIATGAKIIGDVKIANGVVVGANAVVVKDILEPNITVGGIPAKKISNKSSEKYIVNDLRR